MSERMDKVNFIQRHKDEMRPTADDPDLLDRVNHKRTIGLSNARIDRALEHAETKLFRLEKQSAEPGAQRVFLTTNDPGSFNAIGKLAAALDNDPRCRGITMLASGWGEVGFEKEFGDRLIQVRGKSNLLADVLDDAEKRRCDIAVASVSVKNGPETVALYGAKSTLGAKKLFYLFEGWTGIGTAFSNEQHIDTIDGIFCNDVLAKNILHRTLPNFPLEKIYATGTPVLESLEVEHAEKYREETRMKLGISSGTNTVLYLGDISADHGQGGDRAINEKTFGETLDAISELARENPEKQYACMLRPHPRDPNKDLLFDYAKSKELPPNLLCTDASHPTFSMNEAAYAADVILSIGSTENFLAPLRGRRSLFLGYEGSDMGKEFLTRTYGEEILKEIGRADGVGIASTPTEVVTRLSDMFTSAKALVPAVATQEGTRKILDILFSPENNL